MVPGCRCRNGAAITLMVTVTTIVGTLPLGGTMLLLVTMMVKVSSTR